MKRETAKLPYLAIVVSAEIFEIDLSSHKLTSMAVGIFVDLKMKSGTE